MASLRDRLTPLCGTLAVAGAIACFMNAAPPWAWAAFFVLPTVAWIALGRAWLGALLGAIFGLSS